jgi:hypothetical protein
MTSNIYELEDYVINGVTGMLSGRLTQNIKIFGGYYVNILGLGFPHHMEKGPTRTRQVEPANE